MIMPEKIVKFMTTEVFTRRKMIVIDLEAGYKGVIGLRQYDPREFPDLAMTEEREILASFCSGMEAGRRKHNQWLITERVMLLAALY
jgi:hypothetical protein